MYVFWFLAVCVLLAIGFGVSALFGEKIYDKANDVKDIYVKEKEKEEDE